MAVQVFDFGISVFEHFFDPKKRLFIGYLIAALGIAFFWLLISKKLTIRNALRKIFDRSVFFSTSSRADFKVFLINRAFTFFISPLLLTQLVVATFIFNLLLKIDWGTWSFALEPSKAVVVASFTFCVFVLDDFTKYIVHRWMHKWPLLWSLHKVHHSASHLTPITIYRTHPLEGIVFSLRSAFTQGLSIAVFFYLFGNQVDLFTVLGANVLVFAFNVAGSNLRHSHIGIQYWRWLEYILISPAQHQLHHSIAEEHYDKNFGATLALWDWLFGSLHHSVETEGLALGVSDDTSDAAHGLYALYVLPLLEMGRYFTTKTKELKPALGRVAHRLPWCSKPGLKNRIKSSP